MAGIEFVEVVDVGPGWNKVKASDGNVYTLKGNYNWRSNNPGNIEYGEFAKKMGAIGQGKVPPGRKRGFAIFPSYEAGHNARIALQFESPSYANKTVLQAIERYAPRFENDTDAYAAQVAKAAGVSLDTKMSDLTPAQREAFLAAQERVEGFRPGKIATSDGTPVPLAVAQQFGAKRLPPMNIPEVGTQTANSAIPIPASVSPQMAFTRQMGVPTYPGTTAVPTVTPRSLAKPAQSPSGVNDRLSTQGIPPLPQMRPPAPGYKMSGKAAAQDERFMLGSAAKNLPGQTRVASLDPSAPIPAPLPASRVPMPRPRPSPPVSQMPQLPQQMAPVPAVRSAPPPAIGQTYAGQDTNVPRTISKTVMVANPAYKPPQLSAPGAGLTEAQMRAIRGDMSMVAPKPPVVPQFIPQTVSVPNPAYQAAPSLPKLPATPPTVPQPQGGGGLLGMLGGAIQNFDIEGMKRNIAGALAPAMLGSVAGRTAIIDPMIARMFTRQVNQPMAGQTIQTANSGQQVIGQRVNNSPRGRTVSQNSWFNNVTGV